MDDALVFSSKQKIKCIQFLTSDLLLLSSDSSLSVFQIGTASNIFQSTYPQQILPIKIEVIAESRMLVIQGKMGYNFIFTYDLQKQISIKMIRKYETHMHGFCKMLQISNRYLLAINEDAKSVHAHNIVNGNIQLKYILDDEKICQSVTCMQAANQLKDEQAQKITVNIYLAQEGCKIHKLQLSLCGQSEEDQILETKQSIQIQNKQQIKIITSMLLVDDKLYCLIRKCQSLYIVQAQPTLKMLHSINFKLSMPKNLSTCKQTIDGLSLILTDQNKVLKIKMDKGSEKISTIAQLHQSKSIEYISCTETAICGCSQEKQFFYIQS